MPGEINYKNKYLELRAKYMADLDMAFRLGMEQGIQQAQNDQAMQAEQQQQEMDAAAAGGMGGQSGQPGQEGSPEGQPGQEQPGQPISEHPEGSELDQHIAKLESMIQKSEFDPKELAKSLGGLKDLKKHWQQEADLKKSAEAIKGIAKALHKPAYKLSVQSSHNLSSNAKQAVSLQHKIVNDLMTKMEEEEKRASTDIKNILNIEGLTKKE